MPPNKLPDDLDFDPKRMLNVLVEHKVRFIVVGGIAAIFHASPYATFDLDICPADDDQNLRRLSEALVEMDARMRFTDEPEPIRIDFNPRVLRAAPFLNLETKWGPLDIVPQPAGSQGYESLARDAISVRLGEVDIAVASRTDVLRSKEALYRDKDIPTIRLFQELEERDLEQRASEKRDAKDE
jgi:hypothetical protein